MPTAVGPNTKGEENLVFGYDLGDVSNSYKGEPATNLITSGLPGYFGSGGETLYQERLYGLKSDSGVFQRNYVTNPALENSATYNNNAGLYKAFSTANLNPNTEYIQISFDFYMIIPYVRISSSGTGLNGYLGVRSTDSTVDNYGWNTTYSNGSGDDWNNNSAYIGQWQKVSLIVDLRDDKVPEAITAMYIYNDRTLQGEGIFTNFIITEHTTFPTGPVRYTSGTRSATQGLLDLTGNSTIDLANVSFDSNAQMTFDGTNDYINLPTTLTSSFNPNSFTVEAVVNYDSFGALNSSRPYISNWNSWSPGSQKGFILRTYGVSEYASFWWCDGTNYTSINATTQMTVGQYYYIAATYSPSIVTIYVNGVAENTSTNLLTGVVFESTTRIGFGTINTGYFDGKIPIAKIYNRALTASEIRSNYNAIKGRFNI